MADMKDQSKVIVIVDVREERRMRKRKRKEGQPKRYIKKGDT
jgi:hypothetical protein